MDDLLAENARLIALLEAHGIAWKKPVEPVPLPAKEAEPSQFSPDEKVALFMRLFRGRTDVYPIRWESQKTGKAGYSPVCVNEWRAGVCDKPRIKCSNCSHQLLKPLTDVIVFDHLAGKHTIGVYPLFPNQDTMPKGGFGNLIALPLQKSRVSGDSVCSWMNSSCHTPINGAILHQSSQSVVKT